MNDGGNAEALRATARAWLAAGRSATVVTVRAARGSVPRGVGTRMLVAHDTGGRTGNDDDPGHARDAVVGTIGGGHLEWQAIAHARAGRREPWAVALGPSLGQCCGGALTLDFEPLDGARLAAWPEVAPRFVLQLYGAGHVGRAIVRALADVDCRVRWIDEREAEFPAGPLPAHVEAIAGEPVEAEVDAAPAGACHLILTHSHELDLRLAHAVLRRDDVRWAGLIGSATKRARFEHRLGARGIAADRLARLVCPIGLPGVGGKAPAEVAIAVAAQLLSLPAPDGRCLNGDPDAR